MSLMEPLEPRLLLSADFMPAAADAMADGFDLLEARLDDFLDSESAFDQRVPFLLQTNDDTDNPGYEAPTVGDMFGIPVDANGDGYVGIFFGNEDETVLDGWDDNDDGVVNAAELLDALLFTPLQQELTAVTSGDGTDSFVDALINDIDFLTGDEGFDVTLDELGGGYSLDFDLVSATDLTEDPDAQVTFDLQFSLTLTRDQVPIDLGLEADDLKLLAFTGDSLDPQPVTTSVDSTLTFGLEFGVYTGGQNDTYGPGDADLNANDFFIRRTDEMLFSITAQDNDVDFELNIGFLGADVVNGEIDMQADNVVNLVDPDSPAVLGFDSGQYGIEQPGGVVTAANPLPAADLPHDAGFVLRIGNLGTATDILVADDGNNTGNGDLVDDVQAAVDAAGLDGLVSVGLTGSDELRFSLVSTTPDALGFAGETEGDGLLGELSATPAGDGPNIFEYLQDQVFLLSVGGALPRLVTVRFPDPARDEVGFDYEQEAALTEDLVGQNAAVADGQLSGDAVFTVKVTPDDGSAALTKNITVTKAATDGTDPPDPNANNSRTALASDINDALAAASLDTLLSASVSGSNIVLNPATGVAAVEITYADPKTASEIGFVSGQKVTLSLTADDDAIGSGDLSGAATFDITVTTTTGTTTTTITVNDDDNNLNIDNLATDIDNALSSAGVAVDAEVSGSKIRLVAQNSDIAAFDIAIGNQDIDDLVEDVNTALGEAGLGGQVTASADGGDIRLSSSGGESLEITHTLTFDAGVRGAELDGAGDPPDANFEASIGDDSHLTFTLPVQVEEGLREAGTTDDYDPEDMAIVGNFNPLDSPLATFVATEDSEDVNRFFLDYTVNPPDGDDPLIPVPSPVPDNTLELVNFAEALQFNLVGPGSFIGMFGELGAALDSIMQDPLFAGYDIPFADATLRDLASFEDMLNNSVVYDKGPDGEFNSDDPSDDNNRLLARVPVGSSLVVPDGHDSNPKAYEMIPTFTTAQEMGVRLTEILSRPLFSDDTSLNLGGIDPTYDPDSNELTFDLDLISSDRVSVGVNDPDNPDDANEVFAPAFEFDVGMAPFGDFLIRPEGVETFGGGSNITASDLLVTIEARNAFSATVGFDLTPELDPHPEDDDNLLEQRFFVRDATMRGAFNATLPDTGVEATALVGIIGVDITDIDGSYGAQFGAQLRDVGGAPGSRVTLETLQQDIQETFLGPTEGDDTDPDFPQAGTESEFQGGQEGLEIVTDPLVTRLNTLDFDGQSFPAFSNFAPGSQIVTESGATAYVLGVEDNGSGGTAVLFGASGGGFADDDAFYDVKEIVNLGNPLLRGGVIDGTLAFPASFGELEMAIRVQDGFSGTGFGASLAALEGVSGTVDLNLSAFGNPNTDTPPAVDAGDLQTSLDAIGSNVDGTFVSLGDYADVDYLDILAALQQLGDLVAGLEADYPVLSQTLPAINQSVGDLLGLTEGVDRAVAEARSVLLDQQALLGVAGNEVPTLTLQGLAGALRGAFGLPDDSTGVVIDVETVNTTPYLTLDFDIEETISTTLGLDIDLGDTLPNLTSAKVLRADGSLGWGFKIGIDLDNAQLDAPPDLLDNLDPDDFKLFNPEGGLEGSLSITGEGAEGAGLVFLAQVGDASVQVMDALVDIQLDFSLGGMDFSGSDGVKNLAAVDFGDFPEQLIPVQDYDISIPLFDIDGGLTGFLAEIAVSGTELIDDAPALLESLLDPSDLSDLEGKIGDFVDGLDEFDPLDNLLLLTDAADLFFELIQDGLDRAASINIPIIGDNLADGARFIEQFRDQFINGFRHLIEYTNDISVSDVTGYINDFFQNTIGLDAVNIAGNEIANDPLDSFDDEIRWTLSLGDTYSVPFDLGFDLGVPLLNMRSDIPVEVGLEWALDIGLGVNRNDGAFVILDDVDGQELEVSAFVDLPEGTPFQGNLGFLAVDVTNNGSGLEFDFGIDLSNTAGGDILPIADIGNLGFEPVISGGPINGNEHILDLSLAVGITGADFIIPRLTTDFVMDWSLGETPEGAVDNVIQEGLELLDFGEVKIDLNSLLGGFVGDVLGKLDDFLGPLQDINDFLNEDIPIISQLFGPTSLLDLAQLLGLADTRMFEAIDQISDILDVLDGLTGDAFITLGDLEIFDSGDVPNTDFANALFDTNGDFTEAIKDSFGDLSGFLGDIGKDVIDNFSTAVADSDAPGSTKSSFTNTTNLSVGGAGDIINLPWLDNPEVLLGLLVGQDVSLIEVDLPPLGVGFDYDQFVTIFGPLGVSIGFGFFVGADFSAGFNTYGLKRFAESDFTNPGLIFDGFFLGDRDNVTTGADIEELFLEMTLTAAAELNLGVASGGVGGGISARLGLDLYDPDNDGAVHISEMINTIENELRSGGSDFDAARSIFDLQGSISAELFWYLEILKAEFGDTIFGPEEIFTFEIPFDRPPILGTVIENDGPDTLVINAGPNAVDRLNGDVSDGNESFEVEYDSGAVKIKSPALGVNDWQTYTGNFDHIVFLGGEGDDSITFTGFDESDITFDLQGGAGDDVIEFIENTGVTPATGAGAVIRGGAGNDRLIGSHLDDEIYGGLGDDEIEGGRGYDVLFGDDGKYTDGPPVPVGEDEDLYPDKTIGARVSNLDGRDTIRGGDGDDIIIGGGGIDDLAGDGGADIILGDGGRFGFELVDGHLDVNAFNIPEFIPNDRLDDSPATSTAQKMQNILLALTGIFTGTDLGNGADDMIHGGDGDDIIFGGAANDDISGDGGGDHVVGGRGFDTINGNEGDDVLFGNEQDDVINGGDGSDVISGGFGDDVLHGNAGKDYMTGSRGRDVMYGDGGDDELHGEGEPDILFGGADNDLVVGGVGADIIMGDDGIVVKFDGIAPDTDLVIGNGAAALAAPFEAGADNIFGSLDLILTDVEADDGDDILSGGEGGDMIFGGGGNDLGGGDVDPRSSTADDGNITTPDGNDVLIGDGGVVEFNQRRLQRIASVFAGDPDISFRDTLYGDNGDDIIIGGRGSDGDNNGDDSTLNIPSLGIPFLLAGGHGPGRGPTDPEVSDEDVILGDNGELVYVGAGDMDNFGELAYIQTTDTGNATGGADTAFGEEGNDIILGGVNGSVDVLGGSTGEDVILGDNGLIHFYYDWANDNNIEDYASETYLPDDGDPSTIDLIRSFHDGLGGVDIVSGEEGSDVLMGGEEGDFVYGDNAAADSGGNDMGDIMLGDNGDIFLDGDAGMRLVQGVAVDLITTTDVAEGTGGADIMSGNAGDDVIIGGVNAGGIDKLYGDARTPVPLLDGDDIMLGDNGLLDYTWDAVPDTDRNTLDLIATTARAGGGVRGGVDWIFGNAGGDTVFGGGFADHVFGDNDESVDGSGVADLHGLLGGADILFGDQGKVELVNNLPALIESTDLSAAEGGADHIQGNDYGDFILGGVDDDELHGEAFLAAGRGVADLVTTAGMDTLLGDEGRLRFNVADDEVLVSVTTAYDALGDGNPLTLDRVETFATGSLGGNDDIYGNGGDDVAMGGFGDDLIHGDFYLGSLTRALNPGDDDLLGDGGQKFFQNGHAILLRSIETGEGGSDTIHGNDGDDTILGGMFDDLLYGETDAVHLGLASDRAGEDIMLGDNGRLDWTLPDDTIPGRQDVVDAFGSATVTVDPYALNPDLGWITLDRITTIAPVHGGNDVIYGNGNSAVNQGDVVFGGTGNDNLYGDTAEAAPDGVDGPDGGDLLFGDHGKLYPSLPGFDAFFVNNNFFSIDTREADGADFDGGHNDFTDFIQGNAASDILIGGQDDDVLLGGSGDDDLIGGHNVAGGMDELDAMPGPDRLAITPNELADLDPSDVNEINDIMDGGTDDDVLAGDNAIIIRQLDNLSPRYRMTANGLLYTLDSATVGNLASIDVGFSANVTGDYQPHQDMELVRTVTLLDHSEAIETAAADNPAQPRVFGNDVMAGAPQDDEMFGQLGDDILQGDGSISLTAARPEADFDPYSPAQDADPSFDVRNVTRRIDLVAGHDTEWTLRFDVFEDLEDGDDYIEGNGGNDRLYGNLGQDDIIGGSSSLFGLGDADAAFHGAPAGNDLRPDGADLIYGGAGNPALLARNASFGGIDNDVSGDTIVPADERHATDADTILGDNGDIFRIVVDTDPETEGDQVGYAVFNYDRDAVTADGFEDDGFGNDDLTIRVRAVNFGDYGYAYVDGGEGRETLEFLATARGEGDLIYGESGDDLVHGMTGDDVIFGNSGHDDLYGEIGNDFILGGTGVDGIVGDDGLILTSRNSDQYGEDLYGIQALLPEQTNLKKNESPDPDSLNAEISSPGNIQLASINVENELIKSVELFSFRTDDLDGMTTGEFGAPVRFNDIVFGGLDNDFIHAGDGDDAISGAEALPAYYSGAGFESGPGQAFTRVNTFLQAMQNSPPNAIPVLADNPSWFDFAPYNPGDILRFEGKPVVDGHGQNPSTRDEFAWYDEFNPRRKLMFDIDAAAGDVAPLPSLDGVASPIDFILNFDESEGPEDTRFSDAAKPSDGDDRLFGDLGNDWQVGGSGRDHMYGGRGNDLLNMDDDHDSGFSGRVGPHDPAPDPLDNKDPDEYQAYADIAYAGAGRDVMILNTGADRSIDWVGEFNSYIVPFSPFGAFHISRTLQPQVPEFLHALSGSDGVDARVDDSLPYTNTVDGQLYVDQKNADVRTDGPDPDRSFEPYGELGMVRQTDFDWQEQTGAPNDPQPGNLQGKREIMRRELFNDPGAAVPLAADSGSLSITGSGTLLAEPDTLGGEVVGLYPLDALQPTYAEILVTVNADKDKAGSKSNAYVLFDYQGAEDFKFAGVEVGTDKLQIGHRDASGWVVDVQIPVRLRSDTDYDLTVVLFGSQATVYVNENENTSFDFGEPLNDGGMVGLGTNNAIARFDDLQIQTLPPEWTFSTDAGFDDASDNPFISRTGNWDISDGRLHGSSAGQVPALATDSIDVAAFSRLEMLGTLNSDNQGGFIFDYYSNDEFKYVALDVQNDEVIIGHYLDGQWSVDAVANRNLEAGTDYSLMVTLFGSTVTVSIDGKSVLTHSFNSLLNDGQFGVMSAGGGSHFDDFLVRGDDPAYAGSPLRVDGSAATVQAGASLDDAMIEDVSGTAVELLSSTFTAIDGAEFEDVTVEVADLPGDYLAVYEDDHIILDYNAAGYGWYTGTSSDVEGIDLLSVLLHEYGHAMGLEHDSGLAFMADELGVGERFEVTADDTVMVFDEDTGDFLSGDGDETGDDLLLLYESTIKDDDDTHSLVQWERSAGFSGRTKQFQLR